MRTACAARQIAASLALRGVRFLRFGAVGVLGALAYVALTVCLVELGEIEPLLAACLAFLPVVLQNYVLHYGWTFKSRDGHGIALPKFALMSAFGFGLNALILFAGVKLAALDYRFVQPFAIAIVVLWNYLASVLWVFKRAAPIVSR
ncbi:MAG: GtrA family protein [Gammaproteobacteria bacterium]